MRSRRWLTGLALCLGVGLAAGSVSAWAQTVTVNGLDGTTTSVVLPSGSGSTAGAAYGLGETWSAGLSNSMTDAQALKLAGLVDAQDATLWLNDSGYFWVPFAFDKSTGNFTGAWYELGKGVLPQNLDSVATGTVPMSPGRFPKVASSARYSGGPELGPGESFVTQTVGEDALLGSSGQLLVDDAAEASAIGGVLSLVGEALPILGALPSELQILESAMYGSYDPGVSVQDQMDQGCRDLIQGNKGFPPWDDISFKQIAHADGAVTQAALDRTDSSAVICDPAQEFPRLYSAATIAREPWQLYFCISVQNLDGGHYWWPQNLTNGTTDGQQYWNWADPAMISWLNTACPPADMTAVLGTAYTGSIAGGTPPPPPGPSDYAVCNLNVVQQGTYNGQPSYVIQSACNQVTAHGGSGFGTLTYDWVYSPGGVEQANSSLSDQTSAFSGGVYTGTSNSVILGSGPDMSGFHVTDAYFWPGSGPTYYVTLNSVTQTSGPPTAPSGVAPVPGNNNNPTPGSGTGVVTPPATFPTLPPPAPGVTSPSTLPAGSSSSPDWGPIEWLGNQMNGMFNNLGGSIVSTFSSGASAITGALGSLFGGVSSLPGEIVNALAGQFVPSPGQLQGAANQISGAWHSSFAGGGITFITGLFNGAYGAATTALGQSQCGPYIGFPSETWGDIVRDPGAYVTPAFGVYLPSPPPCPGNGPAGADTAFDTDAYTMLGYHDLVRGIAGFAMVWAFGWSVVGWTPWAEKSANILHFYNEDQAAATAAERDRGRLRESLKRWDSRWGD